KIINRFISDQKLFQPFKLNNNESLTNKILNHSYRIFFLLIIILGVYLRLYTGPGVDLWFDEAYRAVGYVENGFTHWATVIDKIRPIGYTFLTYIIQKIHNTDFMLRLPSLIASILTIFVVWGISNRIFGDPDKPVKSQIAILLSVFLVSFNPTLIGFSKEFKPYALELFLHLLLIYLLLLYLQNNTYRNLLFLLFSSFISIFFAYNIIFALPIILIIVLLKSLGDKDNRSFILICLTIVIIIISFTIIKVNLVGSIIESKNESSEFWGNKYDVFITDDETGFVDRIKWYYTKTADIIEFSTKNLIFIDLPVKINSFFNIFLKNISILLLFLGLIVLFIKRKIPYVLLFFLPIVIVIILNVLKIWTYGNFRANLFIYGYFLFIVLFGINFLLESKDKILRYAIVSFIVVFYFILQFPYNFNFYRTKVVSVPTYNAMELVNFLYNHERLLDDEYKKTIYTDLHVSDPLKYYVNYNKDTAPKYNKLYREEFRNYSEVIPIFRIPLEDSEKMVVEALKKEKFIYFCFLYNSFSPLYDFNTKEDKRLFALDIFNKYSNVKQYILDTNVIFYCESTIFDEYAK
ncbi:MAG TPA: glycosyltransferase family 39 protein, partial [Spirochaetota bacterium]|nr:glycosyltransferase family 39 protein [Spirochaetota bacterium]